MATVDEDEIVNYEDDEEENQETTADNKEIKK
jgi:hypothetical protein